MMRQIRGLKSTLASAALFLFAQGVAAIDLGSDRIRLHGYGSLAITDTGNDGLFFPFYLSNDVVLEEGTSLRESVLGLQLDATVTENIETSVQMVARDRADGDHNLNNYIERAFVKYSKNNFYARAGRLGLDVYMLSEYRDVGFAYSWAHPSIDFYGPFGMDYLEGAEIGYSFYLPNSSLETRLYGGSSSQNLYINNDNLDVVYSPILGATFIWNVDAWSVRLGHAVNTIDSELDLLTELQDALSATPSSLWPEAADLSDSLDFKGTSISYTSIGARYDAYPWIAEAEIAYTNIDNDVFPTFFNGYLSAAYSLNSITLFTMAGFIEPGEDRLIAADPVTTGDPFTDAGLSALQDGVQTIYDAGIDQKTLSVGFRWDLMTNAALKAQWDHTWVEEYGGGLWYTEDINTEPVEVDTFTIKLDFIF